MAAEEYDQQSFPEFLYLEAFTDVRDAVASGAIANGWEHYVKYGKAEIEGGRRPSPFAGGRLDMLRSVLPPEDNSAVPPAPAPVLLTASGEGYYLYETACAGVQLSGTMADLFDEELYLALNPDVAAKVSAGEFSRGRAHWLKAWARRGRARAAAKHRG